MAAEAGWSYWSLVPRFKPGGFKDAVDKASPEIEAPAKKAGERTGTFMSTALGKSLKLGSKTAAAGAATLVGTALYKGFGRLKAIEEAQAKLTGLGHSAESVSKIMDNALAAVKGTAFGLGDAATIAASTVAAGVKPGKDLERTLKLVGDAATIAGTDLNSMGSIFNKVAASNKIQGDVIAQLNDAGIPIIQLLSKELGVSAEKTVELASKGKVNFKTFQTAMEKGMGGAALKSGNTFSGSLANVQAALGRLGASTLKGIFPQLTKGMGDATKQIDKLGPKAEKLGEEIGDFARDAGPVAVDVFKALGSTAKTLLPPVQGLLKGFADMPSAAKKVTLLAGAGALLVKNFGGIDGIMKKFSDESERAALKATALKAGAAGASAGLFMLADKAGGATTELGAVATIGGSVAAGFAAGGPWGAAVGGAAGLLSVFGSRSRKAAEAQAALDAAGKAVAATLDHQTGALTKNTRQMVAKQLADSGVYAAARKVGVSLEDVTAAALGNEAATKRVTAASREWFYAQEGDFDARRKAMETVGKLTGSIDANAKAIDKERQSIKDVNSALSGLDGKKAKVKVTADTKAARDAIDSLRRALSGLRGTSFAGTWIANAGGFETGGWTGPGAKHQVAGVVHRDEFVVRKEARRRAEAAKPGALDRLNATGQWPGYANGGRVGAASAAAGSMTRIDPSQIAEIIQGLYAAVFAGANGVANQREYDQLVTSRMPGAFAGGAV